MEESHTEAEKRALFDKVYRLTYRAWYSELVLGAWLASWTAVDSSVAIATALASSGSAIAGWALWSEPGWKQAWMVIASVGAVASLLHTRLGVGHQMDKLRGGWAGYLDLRSDSKTLLDRLDLGEPFEKASEQFLALAARQKAIEATSIPGMRLFEPSRESRRALQDKVEEELRIYLPPKGKEAR